MDKSGSTKPCTASRSKIKLVDLPPRPFSIPRPHSLSPTEKTYIIASWTVSPSTSTSSTSPRTIDIDHHSKDTQSQSLKQTLIGYTFLLCPQLQRSLLFHLLPSSASELLVRPQQQALELGEPRTTRSPQIADPDAPPPTHAPTRPDSSVGTTYTRLITTLTHAALGTSLLKSLGDSPLRTTSFLVESQIQQRATCQNYIALLSSSIVEPFLRPPVLVFGKRSSEQCHSRNFAAVCSHISRPVCPGTCIESPAYGALVLVHTRTTDIQHCPCICFSIIYPFYIVLYVFLAE